MSQGGLDSRRAPGATRASQGAKAPFQNSFSSLSAPCSCFLHVYIISINPRSIQGRVCKYGIIGLLTMISTKLLLPIRHRILDSRVHCVSHRKHLVTSCVKYQSYYASFEGANCMILRVLKNMVKNISFNVSDKISKTVMFHESYCSALLIRRIALAL